jgi:polyketide biosynthesis enoyl-CoA hydratase PksI
MIVTSEPSPGILAIEIADPEGANALSEPLVMDLLGALRRANEDRDLRVVVLLGTRDVFCSGASRELLDRVVRGEIVPSDHALSKALLDVSVPTIAAMEGHAVGGGLALGLCADITLIARESRYGCSFMNMGFTPGMGITRLLENVLSRAVAHELLYTGELRRGADFDGRSGFNAILPRDEVRDKAFDVAERIAEKPRIALEALKRSLSVDKRRAFEETRSVEAMMHSISFAQRNIAEIIEKGAVFEGVVPAGVPHGQ